MEARENRQRGRRRLKLLPALGLAAAATLALSACGGDASGSDAVPVAEDCLQSWNAESASLTFGRHVYGTHQSKQAQVTLLEPAEDALTVGGDEACVVVFAVPESDYEYGDVGLVVTKLGWASMRELAPSDQTRLKQIQREATEAPNANLFPDGTLDPN